MKSDIFDGRIALAVRCRNSAYKLSRVRPVAVANSRDDHGVAKRSCTNIECQDIVQCLMCQDIVQSSSGLCGAVGNARVGCGGPFTLPRLRIFDPGVARVRCPDCQHEFLIAFSCKLRELSQGTP